jgi:chromosome segregation ATPase
MDNSEKLYQERKKILKEFFETKARLEEVTLENNSLKSQNELLEDRLAEREEEMQNLFSFIHTGA